MNKQIISNLKNVGAPSADYSYYHNGQPKGVPAYLGYDKSEIEQDKADRPENADKSSDKGPYDLNAVKQSSSSQLAKE